MPLAAAVAVVSVARSGGVVTVTTSAAHGLSAGQGFQLAGTTDPSFSQNATVATVPTSTSFTFAQAGADAASAPSTGSVLPAKEVVILETIRDAPGYVSVRYLLWLTTTSPSPPPTAQAKSQWSGASAAENAALAVGTTIELVRGKSFPVTATKLHVETLLDDEFRAEQQVLNNRPQPGALLGIFSDGTGWSA